MSTKLSPRSQSPQVRTSNPPSDHFVRPKLCALMFPQSERDNFNQSRVLGRWIIYESLWRITLRLLRLGELRLVRVRVSGRRVDSRHPCSGLWLGRLWDSATNCEEILWCVSAVINFPFHSGGRGARIVICRRRRRRRRRRSEFEIPGTRLVPLLWSSGEGRRSHRNVGQSIYGRVRMVTCREE